MPRRILLVDLGLTADIFGPSFALYERAAPQGQKANKTPSQFFY